MLIDFQNSFTARLGRKFATKISLKPLYLKYSVRAAISYATVIFQKSDKLKSAALKDVVLKIFFADLLT